MKEEQTVGSKKKEKKNNHKSPVCTQCIYPVIDTDRSDVRARHEGFVFEANQEASFTHPRISQQHHLDIKTSEIRSRRADDKASQVLGLDSKQKAVVCRKYWTKLIGSTLNWALICSSSLTAEGFRKL
jgi:hypothetical protein